MTTRSIAALGLLAALPLLLTACGGAAGAAYPRDEPLPSSAEDTLALLDRAEGDLRLALGPGASPAGPAPAASASPMAPPVVQGADAPPPPPAAPVSAPPGDAERAEKGAAMSLESRAPSDPCSNACRALASMTRAATHLCSLAGAADARCTSAEDRVKSATARVHAECPACAAAGG